MQEEPATSFFLPVVPGQRYCLYQAARTQVPAVLFVHPFGEELNRSRRMAALQARALAKRGVASLRIDLYGCGDSSGDFSDASWNQWRADLIAASAWLRDQGHPEVSLLGLRLGCLLAMDVAADLPLPVRQMILWQKPASASQFLTQWLRLRSVNAMLGDSAAQEGPQALRERLRQGETIEVGGYELAPHMAAALDSLAPEQPSCPVTSLQIGPTAPAIPGPAFWSTPEITQCDALIEASCAALDVP
jgi:exosortase A-associated hydrolase 2